MADKSSMSTVQQQRLDLLGREMLRAAGFKPRYLRHALKRTVETLDAHETKVFAHEGQITDKIDLVNHRARLSAADTIFRMTGMYPSVNGESGNARGVVVEVQLLTPDGGRTVIRVGAGTPGVVKHGS